MNSGANSSEIWQKSAKGCAKLLSKKSRERYQTQCSHFSKSKVTIFLKKIDDEVLFCSFSLWPKYFMIKLTLISNENLDISCCPRLVTFLNKQSIGYKPKQSKSLTQEEINPL